MFLINILRYSTRIYYNNLKVLLIASLRGSDISKYNTVQVEGSSDRGNSQSWLQEAVAWLTLPNHITATFTQHCHTVDAIHYVINLTEQNLETGKYFSAYMARVYRHGDKIIPSSAFPTNSSLSFCHYHIPRTRLDKYNKKKPCLQITNGPKPNATNTTKPFGIGSKTHIWNTSAKIECHTASKVKPSKKKISF